MRRSERGISTVIDVSMALLLISASVVMLAIYINDQETSENHEEVRADQTAELLSSTTVQLSYSLGSFSEPAWDDARDDVLTGRSSFTSADYSRTNQGTSAEMLAEAAVFQASFGGTKLTNEGNGFAEAATGSVRGVLGNSGVDAYVRAVWRPYEKSNIEGTVSVGSRPPGDEDVSSSTLVVPSGVPPIDDETARAAYLNGGYDALSELIARRIVEGFFPPVETQHALESQGIKRAVTLYRYKRAKTVFGFGSYDTTNMPLLTESVVSSTGANAHAANSKIVSSLAEDVEADLESEYGDGVSPDQLASDVSTGEVTILVQTWT